MSAVGSVSAADVDQLKINTTATTSTTLASGADSVAIGQDAKTADTAKNSIAIGKGATVSQNQWYAANANDRKLGPEYASAGAIAIGNGASSQHQAAISLGQ